MKKSLIISSFALAALIGASQEAMAICTFTPAFTTNVMPLQGANVTVGRDLQLGGIIYRQRFQPGGSGLRTSCTGTRPVSRQFYGGVTAPMPLSSWNTGSFGGKTYETGVPGIGAVIVAVDFAFPFRWGVQTNCIFPTGSPCTAGYSPDFFGYELYLIKTAPIVGSGSILGSRLPTGERGLLKEGVSYPYMQGSFSGIINVVSKTCQTSDVRVDMGVHKVNDFTQANSATPWKDFSITLNDCPAFYGSNSAGFPSGAPPGSVLGAYQSNTIRVNLLGTVPPANASQGILALNPAGSTFAWPATGIGLQVANDAGIPVAIGPGAWIASGISTQAVDGMSYTIPLKARYLRTTGQVGAGQANATAQFTISYQ